MFGEIAKVLPMEWLIWARHWEEFLLPFEDELIAAFAFDVTVHTALREDRDLFI